MWTVSLVALALALAPEAGAGASAVRGRLVVSGGAASLDAGGKRFAILSHDKNIDATLRDARLSGRELKLTGTARPDGSFDVDQLYIVHGDTDYRLIYFCNICNITTFSPGDCACCQAPVEPVEVLPTDPRIYQERLPSRAPQER